MRKYCCLFLFSIFILFSHCGVKDENKDENNSLLSCQNIEIPSYMPKSVFIDYHFPYQLDKGKAVSASLALDSDGYVYIVYFVYNGDASKAELRYATDKDGMWQIFVLNANIQFDDLLNLNTAISIDSQKKVHIVYTHRNKNKNFTLWYLTNSSGQWTEEKVEAGQAGYLFSTEINSLSLVIDKAGVVHLSYAVKLFKGFNAEAFVNSTLRHAWRKIGAFDQKWQLEDILDTGGKDARIFPSQIVEMVVDSEIYLYVAFCRGETGNLGYITKASSDKIWGVETLAKGNCLDQNPSLVIDGSNVLHLAYLGQDLINGKTVLKYGNNKDNEWKFYIIEKDIIIKPLNLATNSKDISLIYFQEKEIKENEICRLPAGWYLKVYSNLGPSPDSAYFPFLWGLTWLSNPPLKFFDFNKTGDLQYVVSAENSGLQFVSNKSEPLEGILTYTEPKDCGSPPSCLLASPVGCKEGNICRYPEVSEWQWPEGNGFKTKSINPIYIFPQEIPNTTGILPTCVLDSDCKDGLDCTTDSCLPDQICSHQSIGDCCENNAECEDENPDTINQCSAHECIIVCTKDCAGKECGDDNCGGSCGECYGQDKCENWQCVCQLDCIGKECGDDGCGGSCGSCMAGKECNSLGKCKDLSCGTKFCPLEYTCAKFYFPCCIPDGDTDCGNGKYCDWGETCQRLHNEYGVYNKSFCCPPDAPAAVEATNDAIKCCGFWENCTWITKEQKYCMPL